MLASPQNTGTILECLPQLIWHNSFTLQSFVDTRIVPDVSDRSEAKGAFPPCQYTLLSNTLCGGGIELKSTEILILFHLSVLSLMSLD